MDRRSFIKKSTAAGILLGTGIIPLSAIGKPEITKLTILHTNDVHSRIDPFPLNGSKYEGKGGAARRAALIKKIRKAEQHVMLLDAGDIFQGTPYFNLYKGELDIKLMSEMDYDAATIGNHDFDAGIAMLAQQTQHASFSFLSCNYDFSNTPMKGKTKPYQIFHKGDLKIGVLGVGIQLDGLVPEEWYGETRYLEPIEQVNYWAAVLKEEQKCDYVICLSHLGFQYDQSDKVSDLILAEYSRHIDLIIGGHTHTFLERPHIVENLSGQPVLINQVGWAGIILGRIDVYFERNKKKRCVSCENLWIET
jgi:5'-nucleotidase